MQSRENYFCASYNWQLQIQTQMSIVAVRNGPCVINKNDVIFKRKILLTFIELKERVKEINNVGNV